ncbi:MAG: CoA transferase [Chloroflexales bacterium]|nr:CoA transferase [Chloroflexales bacterium]
MGQNGPDHRRAACDQVIQGRGGIMSVTGHADGDPMRVGIALSDLVSGMNAAYAILAATNDRIRTGIGQYFDTSFCWDNWRCCLTTPRAFWRRVRCPSAPAITIPKSRCTASIKPKMAGLIWR